jgi:hypothetical protein
VITHVSQTDQVKANRRKKRGSTQQYITARQSKRPESPDTALRFNRAEFEACCRIIEHEIIKLHPAAAHAALDRFFAACNLAQHIMTQDSPIQVLRTIYGDIVGPSVREENALERYGYGTVRAFLGASREDFLTERDIGIITAEKFLNLQDEVRKTLKLKLSDRVQVPLSAKS